MKRGLLHCSHVKSLNWDVAAFHPEFFFKNSRKSSCCPINTFHWFLVSDRVALIWTVLTCGGPIAFPQRNSRHLRTKAPARETQRGGRFLKGQRGLRAWHGLCRCPWRTSPSLSKAGPAEPCPCGFWKAKASCRCQPGVHLPYPAPLPALSSLLSDLSGSASP